MRHIENEYLARHGKFARIFCRASEEDGLALVDHRNCVAEASGRRPGVARQLDQLMRLEACGVALASTRSWRSLLLIATSPDHASILRLLSAARQLLILPLIRLFFRRAFILFNDQHLLIVLIIRRQQILILHALANARDPTRSTINVLDVLYLVHRRINMHSKCVLLNLLIIAHTNIAPCFNKL